MSHYILDIKSPAHKQARSVKSEYGLNNHGLRNLANVYWNLPTESLYEEIIFRGEGRVAHNGPIVVDTGKHTARSANDKFVVREAGTEGNIWWGEYNRPFDPDKFNLVYQRLQGFLQGRDLFVQHRFGNVHPAEFRAEIVHNRQLRLWWRNQEIRLLRDELSFAA